MNIYYLLKLLDYYLGIYTYSYLYIVLLFGMISLIVNVILYRYSIKGKGYTLKRNGSPRIMNLIFVLFIIVLFSLSMLSKNIELQYSLLVYALAITLTISKLCLENFSILLLALLISSVDILTILNLGIEIGEQTLDTFMVMLNGHWSKSLKDPYYNLINVYSTTKAMLNIIIGISIPESLTTYFLLGFINSSIIILTIYLIATRISGLNYRLVLPALIVLLSNPEAKLIYFPPGLSMAFSLLAILMVLKLFKGDKMGRGNSVITMVLFFSSILTHGTGVVVLLFLVILVMILLSHEKSKQYSNIFLTMLVLYMIISAVRTVFTGALEGAFRTYWGELVRWFTGFGVVRRSVKWSASEVPRVTGYAWAYPISLAIVPLISDIFNRLTKKRRYILLKNYDYLSFTVTSILFVGLGFIATFFSNSLGRELRYPGLILMGISTLHTLRNLRRRRNTWIISCLLIIASAVLGLATPSKIPLYKPYKKLTLCWRGSDYTHYLYARVIACLINNAEMLQIHVKSDDKIPIAFIYLSVYGESPRARIIGHKIEDSLHNILFMFNTNNYIIVQD